MTTKKQVQVGWAVTALDRALLNDGAENAADSLLILEMLFRRHAEQTGEQIVKGAVLP